MIVAITGANGFIGQRLVRGFTDEGWQARAVVRHDFELGDQQLERCFDGADVVVHAAGATRAPTRRTLHESNVRLTSRTADAARRAKVGRFVFLSSQAAAGPASSYERASAEGDEPAPIEAYGRSKLEAERLLHSMSELPCVIVRPAAVYGPGDRDFLSMFRLARRGVALHPGNRDKWISIVQVDDLTRGVMRACVDERAVGRTYFLANDEPIQWGALFGACAASAEQHLKLDLEVPAALVALGARIGDAIARITGRAGLLTSEKVALSGPPYWVCSNARAKEELGWSPSVGLENGLRDTYRWYVANGWL
jgi:Nucleoside-diphosphate-sugar epimerases